MRHARHDRAERRVAQRRVDAERLQQRRQAEPAQRPQGGVLHADAARARQRQAADGDLLDAAGVAARRRAAGQQLLGDALRLGLHRGRRVAEQVALAVEDLLDALAQQRPAFAVDVEVAAEVEQRALADAGAVALGAHQAVGVVDGAVGGACPGASDEHGADDSGGGRPHQHLFFILWHYIRPPAMPIQWNQQLTPPGWSGKAVSAGKTRPGW